MDIRLYIHTVFIRIVAPPSNNRLPPIIAPPPPEGLKINNRLGYYSNKYGIYVCIQN